MKKLILLSLSLILFFCFLVSSSLSAAEKEDLVVADFESYPNNLGGELGVHGSLEPNWDDKTAPFSGIYGPDTPGYLAENVHGGRQSFRLVNALGAKSQESWGSLGIDMGPVSDAASMPKKIEGRDVSNYKYLKFWVKGEKGGEHLEVIFRDARAMTYVPQVKHKVPDATMEWQEVIVPLDAIAKSVDLKALVQIGIAFGNDVGNGAGAIVYLDDFTFTNSK